jgi:signal peptidase I
MVRVPSLRFRLRRRWLVLISTAAAAIAAVVVFASPFVITSVSMASTIQPGEVVLVDRVSAASSVQRGEIIVFYPPNNSSVPYIKRVIGLAGDHVSIVNGVVSVNGVQLDESYLAPNTVTQASVLDFEETVPAGSVFVLGDDRSESWDSRSYGPVPLSSVVGRAWAVLSPSFSLSII